MPYFIKIQEAQHVEKKMCTILTLINCIEILIINKLYMNNVNYNVTVIYRKKTLYNISSGRIILD